VGDHYPGITVTTETTALAGERLGLPPLISALRPYQWPKNGLVFAALVFSAGESWRPREADSWWPLLWRTLVLFVCWCMVSSAMYLLNDIRDRELDRVHPRKRYRPIARGAVTPQLAAVTAFVLGAVAIPAALLLDLAAGAVLAGYTVVMLGYSGGLKRVAILDLLILCVGVVARAVAGAAAIDVEISPWLYVCSSFAALFIASSKRWSEYRQLGADAAAHRPVLAQYSNELLGQLMTISGAGALLSYALYTIESRNVPENGSMALTIPFVTFALFRYLLLLSGPRKADAPDQILFTDPQIIVSVAGFVITAGMVMLIHQS
jgi:4-hydroxybenzoate polyprenyltransferase